MTIAPTTSHAIAGLTPWRGHADDAELARWRAVATTVAAALATDVVERDRSNTLPVAPLVLLRESGLADLVIPERLGGHGAHWQTALAVTRIIARVDASIAQSSATATSTRRASPSTDPTPRFSRPGTAAAPRGRGSGAIRSTR